MNPGRDHRIAASGFEGRHHQGEYKHKVPLVAQGDLGPPLQVRQRRCPMTDVGFEIAAP